MKTVIKFLVIAFLGLGLMQLADLAFYLMNRSDGYLFNLGLILFAAIFVAFGFLGIVETVTTCELGSPISEKDISDYLDRIEKENLIEGVTKRWNDKFVLNVRGYSHRHTSNPNIYQTQYSLLFPYHISDVGVIPVWSKSYIRLKTIFKENIENSSYKTDKRKKLGLD